MCVYEEHKQDLFSCCKYVNECKHLNYQIRLKQFIKFHAMLKINTAKIDHKKTCKFNNSEIQVKIKKNNSTVNVQKYCIQGVP